MDSTNLDSGVVHLDWNILEKGDGASLQIIYAGGQLLPVSIHGTVEGQKTISPGSWSEPAPAPKTVFRSLYASLLLGFIFAGLFTLSERLKRERRSMPIRWVVDSAGVVSLLALILAGLSFLSEVVNYLIKAPFNF